MKIPDEYYIIQMLGDVSIRVNATQLNPLWMSSPDPWLQVTDIFGALVHLNLRHVVCWHLSTVAGRQAQDEFMVQTQGVIVEIEDDNDDEPKEPWR